MIKNTIDLIAWHRVYFAVKTEKNTERKKKLKKSINQVL